MSRIARRFLTSFTNYLNTFSESVPLLLTALQMNYSTSLCMSSHLTFPLTYLMHLSLSQTLTHYPNIQIWTQIHLILSLESPCITGGK